MVLPNTQNSPNSLNTPNTQIILNIPNTPNTPNTQNIQITPNTPNAQILPINSNKYKVVRVGGCIPLRWQEGVRKYLAILDNGRQGGCLMSSGLRL